MNFSLSSTIKRVAVALPLAVGLGSIVAPVSSQATFPGGNGNVFFDADPVSGSGSDYAIHSLAPQNSGDSSIRSTSIFNTVGEDDTGIGFSAKGTEAVIYGGTASDAGIKIIDPATADTVKSNVLASLGEQDRDPAFSPDGKRIVFVSDRDGDAEIYIMNVDGSEQTRLTNSTDVDLQPEITPDGKYIVFTKVSGGTSNIYRMNIDGSAVTQLTTYSGFDKAVSPTVSPDGTKIAYSALVTGNNDIYTANLDGSGVERLTTAGGSDDAPVFSPDGTKIAFIKATAGRIFTMSSSTGETVEAATPLDDIAIGIADIRALNWQPVANTDLGTTVTAASGPFYTGISSPSYTVTVTNGANFLNGVVTSLNLAGATLSSVTTDAGSCTVTDGANASCDLGTVAANGSVKITATLATPTTATTAKLTATTSSWGPQTDSGNDSSSADITVSSDSVKPTAAFVLKDCGKKKGKSCKKLRAKRSSYKRLYAKVSDKDSGIKSAQIAFYSKIKGSKKCYGLSGGSKVSLKRMTCSKAKKAFKTAKAKSSSKYTHYLSLSKTPPKSGSSWTALVKATDNSGNVSKTAKKKVGKLK